MPKILYRELYEEVGLGSGDVKIIQRSKRWLKYGSRANAAQKFQTLYWLKQRWFFLEMTCDPGKVRFDTCGTPEFDDWQWVNYWYRSTRLSPLSALSIAMHCRSSLQPTPFKNAHRKAGCNALLVAQYSPDVNSARSLGQVLTFVMKCERPWMPVSAPSTCLMSPTSAMY